MIMDTKLTLELDKEIVKLAKEYDIYECLSPEVREIAINCKSGKKTDETVDYKKSKADYLIKKYGK